MKIPFPLPGVTVTKDEAAHSGRCLCAIHPACSDPRPHLADKGGIDEYATGMKA